MKVSEEEVMVKYDGGVWEDEKLGNGMELKTKTLG